MICRDSVGLIFAPALIIIGRTSRRNICFSSDSEKASDVNIISRTDFILALSINSAFTFAPASRNVRTISGRAYIHLAACVKGVAPSSAEAFTYAPFARRYFRISCALSVSLEKSIVMSGVYPFLYRAFISAPASTRSFTHSHEHSAVAYAIKVNPSSSREFTFQP